MTDYRDDEGEPEGEDYYPEDDQAPQSYHGSQDGVGSDDEGSEDGTATASAIEGSAISDANEGIIHTPFFLAKRHTSCGQPTLPPIHCPQTWRTKDRLKTTHACLLVCLNIGVEPPDIVKTSPHAKLECWIDPFQMQPSKALDFIGKNLVQQFDSLNPRLRYKPCLDPTMEDIKKFCTILRKTAKEERVLLYYNGHGVPKPTPSGEIWAFNQKYTQYIPVSLSDLHSWIGAPNIFIWDCSAAGNIVHNYMRILNAPGQSGPNGTPSTETAHEPGSFDAYEAAYLSSIHLAACQATETLPMTPELPADTFTSCLTSPIEMALKYFTLQNVLPTDVTAEMVMNLPGDLKDRRSPLGELNWIFTSVTDTIAWTTFSREQFLGLFRHDLMIAAVFRNFLLAERVMKKYQCSPVSYPPLPPTNHHPMWDTWDLAVDGCLSQLPSLMRGMTRPLAPPQADNPLMTPEAMHRHQELPPDTYYHYNNSPFFAEHLTAFEVWLTRGGSSAPSWDERASVVNPHPRRPPEELPILLQVLLAQAHRLRALVLLCQFVDLGPWAVEYALVIGTYPYAQRLLQSPAVDLKPVLVFIWARIIAVEPSCQVDLLRDGLYYFANILAPEDEEQYGPDGQMYGPVPNGSEHRAMCAFILAMVAKSYPSGQEACMRESVMDSCFARLDEEDYLVKQWCLLCVAAILECNDSAKAYAVTVDAQRRLLNLRRDDSAEVRAAAMFTVGVFLGCTMDDGQLLNEPPQMGRPGVYSEKAGGGGTGSLVPMVEKDQRSMEVTLAMEFMLAGREDASPLVRKELVIMLSAVVKEWRGWTVLAAWVYLEEDRAWRLGEVDHDGQSPMRQAIDAWLTRDGADEDEDAQDEPSLLGSFFLLVTTLFELSVDPHPVVADLAKKVVDYVLSLLYASPFMCLPFATIDQPLPSVPGHASKPAEIPVRKRVASLTPSIISGRTDVTASALPYPLKRMNTRDSVHSIDEHPEQAQENGGSGGVLRRTASIASTLRSFYTSHRYTPSQSHANGTGGPASRPLSPPPVAPTPRSSRPSSFYFPSSSPPPSSHPSPIPPPSPSGNSPRSANVVQIIFSVVQDDMERLRYRRRQQEPYSPSPSSRSHSPTNNSSSYYADTDDSCSFASQIRLSPTEEHRHKMPLTSPFFDWSSEYYKEPQMKRPEADEPGSEQYNDQMYRKLRNEEMARKAKAEADDAPHYPWDQSVGLLSTNSTPLNLRFHQYEPHLAMSNETDGVSIWDWSTKRRVSRFSNGNPKGTGITSLHFVNEDVIGMVLTTSSEGVVRIFRNYHQPSEVQLITAFHALPEIIPSSHGSGVVSEWHQDSGTLIVGGDSKHVHIWNAGKETSDRVITTNENSCVTSITMEWGKTKEIAVGFGNGTVAVYDQRAPDAEVTVFSLARHRSWVQNAQWNRSTSKELLSASVDGEVRLWDLRATDDEYSGGDWRVQRNGLSAFAMHNKTPVFASLSQITASAYRTQTLLVHSMEGLDPILLSRSAMPTGLYGPPSQSSPSPYIPFSSSLTFHKNEMMFALGGPEGTVRLVGLTLPAKEKPEWYDVEVTEYGTDWGTVHS